MKFTTLILAMALLLFACSVPTPIAPLLPLPSATPSPVIATQPATPVIIATETPSPTPVLYTVQKGDTLIGIAVKFGITLEALQAANDNVQPEYLRIGTMLIIPMPGAGTPVPLSGLPTSTPVPVALSAPVCYPTATSALYCFVEARNPGDVPLENVAARVILADKSGLPVLDGVAYSALDVIPPGGSAPLAVLFPAPSTAIAASVAQPLSAQPAVSNVVVFEIPTHSGGPVNGQWTVTGQARNPASAPVASAKITLTLYDSAGRILGYRQEAMGNGLGAGEMRGFSISAASLGGPADHYAIAAEGRP